MKAILLAGGFGTRLRPLTLQTPKPIVPIFDRPFLYYQIAVLEQLPEIDEIILSLNYQPAAIESVIGNRHNAGVQVRYLVEPTPLGTGGAVKFAESHLDGTTIVFNGDVLTGIDLRSVLDLHRDRKARATIVLTPVDNPSAYGLVETDADGNVLRFLEKPDPAEINCNTINAGIYVLEPETFDRIPPETKYSIEHHYFPSLVERRETFVAYVDHSYWLDIGTSENYIQVHRDIMSGRYAAPPFTEKSVGTPVVDPTATVDDTAHLEGPCFIGAGAHVGAEAHIGVHSVVCACATVSENAAINGSILWPNSTVGSHANVHDAIVGRSARVDAHTIVRPGTVLGDNSIATSYSKL